MNDLETLDRLGPAPTPLSDEVLSRARAQLDAALAATATPRRPRRLALLGAAAAAAAGIALVPALVSDDSIALAAVDPLTFPVTATWVPAGAGEPVFSRDSGSQWAVYGRPSDQLSVVTPGSFDHWESRTAERPVDVAGRPGTVFTTDPGDVTVAWEQADGDIVGVTGRGRYADPALVERVADSVVDKSQPVDLFLTVAPQGWPVRAYQSDHHVSYGEQGELTVTLLASQAETMDEYGARDVRPVSVDGRPGRLGRQVDEQGETVTWVLETTAPDGQAFSLQAPASLTEAQVVQVAAGVRHR